MDAFNYCEPKESIYLGNRTIRNLGKEVRQSQARAAGPSRSPHFREKLVSLFTDTIVDLPNIALIDRSIRCVAGPAEANEYAYQFQLAHLPDQPESKWSMLLRSDSLAFHEPSDMQASLQQGTAFQLFFDITASTDDSEAELYR